MKLFYLIMATVLHTHCFAQKESRKKVQDSLTKSSQQITIDFLHISPQDAIADIGTGHGAGLVPIANEYPLIHFTLEDHDSNFCNKTMLQKEIVRTGNRTSIDNFSFQYGDDAGTHLPAAGFSKVLAFDLIHELSNKPAMLADIKRILQSDGSFFIREILVHKKIKKDRNCNFPYLTEEDFKKIIAENRYLIRKEQTCFDDGHNRYIKLFECIPFY